MQVEGDNISKLEKADILELTVRHLTKLHSPGDPVADAKRFQAGFGQCAAEACQFILSMPEIDSQISQNLINHLRTQIGDVPLNVQSPSKSSFSPQISPDARSVWSAPSSVEYGKLPSQSNMSVSSSTIDCRANQYKRPDPPHVPVNQSLVCDTSLNSMPRIHDSTRPMTGLLMTVNNDTPGNQNEYGAKSIAQYPDKVEYEVKKKHTTEVKNVIMQRIREQILGRQVKEADLRAIPVDLNNINNLPMHNQYQHNLKPLSYSQEQVQSTSMDLRKKSKGESKHYSPRLNMNHKGYSDPNIIKNEGHFSPEAINYSTSRDTGPIKNIDCDGKQAEASSSARKRTPDYRSMHPKKVFMQPSYSNQDVEVDNVKIHSKDMPNIENLEKRNYSNLRHHRFSTTSNYGDYSYEHYPTASNSQVESNPAFYQRQYRNESEELLDLEHKSKRARLDYQNQVNNENEQEDNMWRPW